MITQTGHGNRSEGAEALDRTREDGTPVWDVWVSYTNPKTGASKRHVKRGFKSSKEAEEHRRKVTAEVDAQRFVKPSAMTLEAYLTMWLDGHRGKQQTVAGYLTKVRLHVIPHIGHIQLGKLTTAHLSALYKRLEEQGSTGGKGPLSPASVLRVHDILNPALKAAVRDGLLQTNPATYANRPNARQAAAPEFTVWTAEDASRFLNCERDSRDHALWHFTVHTGVRRGEVLGLRWRDIDFTAKTAVIRQTVGVIRGKIITEELPKSNKPRVVDLDARTVEVLKAHKAAQNTERLALGERWKDQGLVFARGAYRLGPDEVAGGPRHPDRVARLFDRRSAKHSVPDVRFHDLRHTWATLALKNGIPVKVVQERLGHANPTITMNIYAHALPGMQADAAEQVARLIA